jgi:hypothetical protein
MIAPMTQLRIPLRAPSDSALRAHTRSSLITVLLAAVAVIIAF